MGFHSLKPANISMLPKVKNATTTYRPLMYLFSKYSLFEVKPYIAVRIIINHRIKLAAQIIAPVFTKLLGLKTISFSLKYERSSYSAT